MASKPRQRSSAKALFDLKGAMVAALEVLFHLDRLYGLMASDKATHDEGQQRMILIRAELTWDALKDLQHAMQTVGLEVLRRRSRAGLPVVSQGACTAATALELVLAIGRRAFRIKFMPDPRLTDEEFESPDIRPGLKYANVLVPQSPDVIRKAQQTYDLDALRSELMLEAGLFDLEFPGGYFFFEDHRSFEDDQATPRRPGRPRANDPQEPRILARYNRLCKTDGQSRIAAIKLTAEQLSLDASDVERVVRREEMRQRRQHK